MEQPHRVAELTQEGIRQAREHLAALRAGENPPFPYLILDESPYARPITPAVYVQRRPFTNRREAGEYLSQQLALLGMARIADNAGLWSWLECSISWK